MKILASSVIFAYLFMSSCSLFRGSEQSEKSNEKITINLREEYEPGKTIKIQVKNNSSDTLFIYDPMRPRFEKRGENKWNKVRTRYCPCGASCPPPPEKQLLVPDGEFIIQWDQYEEWCGEKNEKGIPETIRERVGSGLYRVKIMYYTTDSKKLNTINEQFTILEKTEER